MNDLHDWYDELGSQYKQSVVNLHTDCSLLSNLWLSYMHQFVSNYTVKTDAKWQELL